MSVKIPKDTEVYENLGEREFDELEIFGIELDGAYEFEKSGLAVNDEPVEEYTIRAQDSGEDEEGNILASMRVTGSEELYSGNFEDVGDYSPQEVVEEMLEYGEILESSERSKPGYDTVSALEV